MAESRGFEPLEHLRALLFSGQVQLAALPTLRVYSSQPIEMVTFCNLFYSISSVVHLLKLFLQDKIHLIKAPNLNESV